MRTLVATALLLALTACGGGDEAARPARSSAAEDAVESLMRALDDGDCKAAKALVVTPSALDCGLVEESAGSFEGDGIDLDAVKYAAAAVQDDSTTVTITWGNGTPAESYDVQRVAGGWRVVFDSAA